MLRNGYRWVDISSSGNFGYLEKTLSHLRGEDLIAPHVGPIQSKTLTIIHTILKEGNVSFNFKQIRDILLGKFGNNKVFISNMLFW